MKITLALLALAAASVAAADSPVTPAASSSSAAAKPELRGVLATASEQRFDLSLPGSAHSEWVSVGDTFAGWKVAAYRWADSTLVLRQGDGTELDLSLAASHIAAAENKATVADAEAVLQKMHFAKMFTKMMDQQIKAMSGMSKQIAAQLGLNANPDVFAAYQKKSMDLIQSVFSGDEMESAMAQAYSDVFTKDQLDGLGDFFDSPVGQAYTDQMPAVNQRLQAQLMPKVMALMPQLQALGKEQAAALKASASPAPTPATP